MFATRQKKNNNQIKEWCQNYSNANSNYRITEIKPITTQSTNRINFKCQNRKTFRLFQGYLAIDLLENTNQKTQKIHRRIVLIIGKYFRSITSIFTSHRSSFFPLHKLHWELLLFTLCWTKKNKKKTPKVLSNQAKSSFYTHQNTSSRTRWFWCAA